MYKPVLLARKVKEKSKDMDGSHQKKQKLNLGDKFPAETEGN